MFSNKEFVLYFCILLKSEPKNHYCFIDKRKFDRNMMRLYQICLICQVDHIMI